MPAICTQSVSPNNCGHRTHTVTWQGVEYAIQRDPTLLTTDDRQRFLELAARVLEQDKSVAAAQFLNRILHGDEATNVKIYQFFGPGAVITKTNIGTAYVNICPGLNGERVVVDFTGCTQYRLMLCANLVGSGQWGARVVKDSDNAVLHEAANLGAAGERELDSDWQNLPAAFLEQGLLFLRAQAKSTTGADDPVFRSLALGLR